MNLKTTVKLSLALGGLVLFGAGIRMEMDALRWIGIGLVGVAWVLRFWKTPASGAPTE